MLILISLGKLVFSLTICKKTTQLQIFGHIHGHLEGFVKNLTYYFFGCSEGFVKKIDIVKNKKVENKIFCFILTLNASLFLIA
jgi:hypothetical protein